MMHLKSRASALPPLVLLLAGVGCAARTASVGELAPAGEGDRSSPGGQFANDGPSSAPVYNVPAIPQELTLAGSQARPRGIALTATHVYWCNQGNGSSSNGSISRVPKAGGTVEVLASAQSDASGLALDSESVYWTNPNFAASTQAGTVRKMPLAGGDVQILAGGIGYPLAIAVNATGAYVTSSSAVLRVPLAGGAANPIANGVGQGEAMSLAIDAQNLYLGIGLETLPLDGGQSKSIDPTSTGSVGIAVDDTHIYFFRSGALARVAKTGGSPKTLSPTLGRSPTGIAVDGSDAYVTLAGSSELGFADGAVVRVPKTGGARTIIAVNQRGPGVIVVDTTAIFWTNTSLDDSLGSVMRHSK